MICDICDRIVHQMDEQDLEMTSCRIVAGKPYHQEETLQGHYDCLEKEGFEYDYDTEYGGVWSDAMSSKIEMSELDSPADLAPWFGAPEAAAEVDYDSGCGGES